MSKRLYQDWPAYRRAYGAYARWCVGLLPQMFALPGSSTYRDLAALRTEAAAQ